ncbi:MAG: YoaK family protein [Acidimicrobiales bacterium]|jgi:uncharacterized membrane protein YoaK (UPF0700 family)
MTAFLTDVRQTLLGSHGKHGPLPPMLVAMTLVTGLVDAFSYLVLGHVFVANMTGNVVLLGFALVGAPGFSIAASIVAIASFVLGSLAGGRIGSRFSSHRANHLSFATTVQSVFLAAAVILAALMSTPVGTGYRYGLIVVLVIGMGIQNASVRKLAVPDLTATVLTMTITGTAADSTIARGPGAKAGRRIVAVATMLAGAVVGATLIVHHHTVYPLVIALVVGSSVAATAGALGRSDPSWVASPT